MKSFKKLFSLAGRANRLEYFLTTLLNFCYFWVLILLHLFSPEYVHHYIAMVSLVLTFIISFWIMQAVNVRRLHDLGKSGWWNLVMVIPLIGLPFWIMCLFFKGKRDSNKYGDPTKPLK